MKQLLIKNGHVVDPAMDRDEVTDVLIVNDRIEAVGPLEPTDSMEVFDASGLLVMPGAIDLHVHLRDLDQSYKETIKTGTQAALQGGITTVFAMPNTVPTLDSRSTIERYKSLIQTDAVVETYIIGSITQGLEGKTLADLDVYPDLGIHFISDDGHDVNDPAILEFAFQKAKQLGLTFIVHPEMSSIGIGGVMNEGEVSRSLDVPGQPNTKEWKAVERAIALALQYGVRTHLTHISTKESVDLVRAAKQKSNLITCDVTPHHITLTEEFVRTLGGRAKVNPPLRTEEDRQALLAAIADGTVDLIATDHAPHTEQEKSETIEYAAFGFTGLELLLPVAFTTLYHQNHLPLLRVVQLLSYNPAQLSQLDRGTLKPGALANLTLVDLKGQRIVDPETFQSKGKNTPFAGMTLKGWPTHVIFQGKLHSVKR
ncbi:dihydroorotase [Candidatus Peregrinibacteria bacterium]|nr:MAG: dihydroorotase [Candidatus Peregrinibacteria bacterium]